MDRSKSVSPERTARRGADTLAPANTGIFGLQSSFSVQPGHDASDVETGERKPGSQDKFAHTRGKRKRTSREDFAILEGEYQRNSRPDKATRASIVARVSMAEKEVQIWFQNRRQMTRRKCRTWQPNEITSIIRSSQEQNVSSEPNEPVPSNTDTSISNNADIHLSQGHGEKLSCTSSQSMKEVGMESGFADATVAVFSLASSEDPSTETSFDANTVESDSQTSADLTRLQEQTIGDDGTVAERVRTVTTDVDESKKSERKRVLKRKGSAIRLSLSFDGKAEVVLGSDSPSPPKKIAPGEARAGRAGPLQRSQSAINPAKEVDQPLGVDIPGWRPSQALGRSRDARTWEFYCDSDARNVLTKSAEHDQKGSAQAVLGLIRSGSNARKPLTPVKRENVPLQRSESGAKITPASRATSRAKLARTISSVARLQTVKTEEDMAKPAKSKLGDEIEIWEDNFGDSDKENQDPENDGHPQIRVRGREVLSDPLTASEDKENRSRGPSSLASKSARPDDELDAVQNLLSLSQGAWS